MEIEHSQYSSAVFRGIVEESDPRLQLCFLQFLQTEIILNIAQLAYKHKNQHYFYHLAVTLLYFRKYLNRVDRSMYYMFYEEKEFKPLQETFIINIAKSQGQLFFLFHDTYDTLLQQIQNQTPYVEDQDELRNIIETIFFQTDYPLPACKRQTIGVYCETPFQIFMAMLRFPLVQGSDEYIESSLEQMRAYFLEQNDMEKIVKLINQNLPENVRKMSLLRYCPYHLQNIKVKDQLIENFELHNLISFLYKLVITNAESSYIIVKQHEDPIMRMAEFVTRANIYKNIILAIEEKFGFLFESYGDIYEVITKGQHTVELPKFRFWNGALAVWVQQFHGIQKQLFDSFNYIMLKQRQANAINYLTQKSVEFPSVYNTVKLELETKSLVDEKKCLMYKETGISYEEFFEQNIDSYEILAKDFLEHQIDAAINEINVHKVGHSDHVIKRLPFFRAFIDTVKENSKEFYSHLQNIVFKKNSDKKMRISILKDLIKFDLDFIDGKFTKPVILKQVFNSAKSLIESLAKKLPEFAVFSEQASEKFSLFFDFSHKDNLLDYFCTKSQTPNDCNQKLRCFYDSFKEKSVEEMLHLVTTTKDDVDMIDSEIEEEFYESSHSNNNSFMSAEEL